MRYFDDLRVGETIDLGRRTVTAEEIVAFASEWDPQPMHVDTETGDGRLYGGLIASGWHTVCLWMRQLCDEFLLDARSMGSPGVKQLRWKRPVRPGDTLSIRATIVEARPLASRPGLGVVTLASETLNQDGETVMTMTTAIMFERREAAA